MEIQVIHSLKATDTLSRLGLHFSRFVPCCIHILKLYNSTSCLSAKSRREILRNSDCCIILPSEYLLRALSLQRCFDDSEEQLDLFANTSFRRFDQIRSVRLFTFNNNQHLSTSASPSTRQSVPAVAFDFLQSLGSGSQLDLKALLIDG